MRFTDISLAVLAAAHPATSTPLQWAKRQFGGFPGFGGGGGGAVSGEITVDLTKTYQKMDGFGFSLAFQRANLITNNPSEKNRDELMDLLFSTEKGAGFSILRNGIGSSLSSENDWMNTFAPDNPGSPTAEPTYKWDGKDSGQLWVAKTAVEKYGLKYVYGNAWSPPFYMKVRISLAFVLDLDFYLFFLVLLLGGGFLGFLLNFWRIQTNENHWDRPTITKTTVETSRRSGIRPLPTTSSNMSSSTPKQE